MIDYLEVGKRIRYYRTKKSLTQEQLAFDIETSASYLSNIERAVKKPSLQKIAQIADVLDVTVEDLIYPSKNPSSMGLTDLEKQVILCPKSDRDRLLKNLGLSDEYVFPNGNFRYHTYNDKVKDAAKAIGLDAKDFHTHCLRSTAATNTYNSCYDIKQVQLLLGHTTPEMTSKYVKDWRGIEVLRETMSKGVADVIAAPECEKSNDFADFSL